MGLSKFLLTLSFTFLSPSGCCYGRSLEKRSPGHIAEASPFHVTAHTPDLSGMMSKAGMWLSSEQPNRSILGSSSEVVSVKDFGAKGDGSSDDTKAFIHAWKAACSSSGDVTIFLVPENKAYLLKPVTFSGPCKSNIVAMVKGTVVASPNIADWAAATNRRYWVVFDGIKNLRVEGGGTFNGNGQIWWKNSCKVDKSLPCNAAPTALTFKSCTSLEVDNLELKDSQRMHVSFERCTNVKVSNLGVSAPETSPNTDGIHISGTTGIHINHCAITTGDDCISIVGGSRLVTATNIICGPSHGISVGSLGADGSQDTVSDVLVDTAELQGTTNGVRIKTWQGGRGYARNITFQNIVMRQVKNPIIIDQNYCDSSKTCSEQKSAVAIIGVTYKNITGTSATGVAMDFDCSKSIPCKGIVLQDIELALEGGGSSKSTCKNAPLSKSVGTVVPLPCTS